MDSKASVPRAKRRDTDPQNCAANASPPQLWRIRPTSADAVPTYSAWCAWSARKPISWHAVNVHDWRSLATSLRLRIVYFVLMRRAAGVTIPKDDIGWYGDRSKRDGTHQEEFRESEDAWLGKGEHGVKACWGWASHMALRRHLGHHCALHLTWFSNRYFWWWYEDPYDAVF